MTARSKPRDQRRLGRGAHLFALACLVAHCFVVSDVLAQESAKQRLCEGVATAQKKSCRQVCAAHPASTACLVFLRFGAAGVAARKAVTAKPALSDKELSKQTGMAKKEVRHLRHFLEDSGLEKAVLRSAEERKRLEHALELNAKGGRAYQSGTFDAALEFYRKAQVIRQEVYGTEHPVVAKSSSNIGVVYDAQGEHARALEHHQKALGVFETVYGLEHPHVATCLNNIGSVHKARGEYDEALANYRRALAIQMKLYDGEHPLVATVLNNIANVYGARGEHAKALAHHKEALARRTKLYGAAHPEVATSLNNLGSLYRAKGEYDEALDYYRRAHAIWKETHGAEHRHVATSSNNIGNVYEAKGEYARALEHYKRALAIGKKVLDADHPELATSLNDIGDVYKAMGEYAKALAHYRDALGIREKAYGAEHSKVAASLNAIGNVHLARGEPGEALEHYQRALAIREKVYGAEHLTVAKSLSNIGVVYDSRGEHDEALAHHERALGIFEKVYGLEHPHVAACLNNMGSVYNAMGDYAEALVHYRRALAIHRALYEGAHPLVATMLNNIANVHAAQGDHARALERHKEALAIREKVYGKEHSHVATSLNNIGSLYHARGEHAEALEYYRKALSSWKKVHGTEHPHVAKSLNNIGNVYEAKEEYTEALAHYRKALAMAKKVYGAEHKDVAINLNDIGHVHRARGEYKEALEHHRAVLAMRTKIYGDGHPLVAASLTDVGVSLASLGKASRATELLQSALDMRYGHFLANVEATGTDIGIRRFLSSIRHDFEWFLSLERNDARDALAASLRWQGLATRAEQIWRDRQRLFSAAGEDEKALLTEHRELQRRRLRLVNLAAETKEGRAVRAKSLAKLGAQVEKLEQRLKEALPAFAAQRKVLTADADALCAAVRRNQRALASYVSYRQLDPRAKPSERGTLVYAAFVAVPNKKEGCTLTRQDLAADDVDQAVDAYRQAVSLVEKYYGKRHKTKAYAEATAAMNEAGKELRRLVWDPVADKLGRHKRVDVVPDARLLEVPIGALANDDDTYVIEDLELSYLAYPAAVLRASQADTALQANKPSGAFVAGDVDYDIGFRTAAAARKKWVTCDASCQSLDQKQDAAPAKDEEDTTMGSDVCGYNATWQQLPATEVQAVAKRLGASMSEPAWLVTGASAHEIAVREGLSGKRVIHIATHGFFSPAKQCRRADSGSVAGASTRNARLLDHAAASAAIDPLRLSALVLSGANRAKKNNLSRDEDGVLSARDIVALDLRGAELVTLAACETGRGSETAGEGALGLARAFLVAGANTAVVSQWQVPGKKTVALFDRFYALAFDDSGDDEQTTLAPARALRKAQIEQIEAHRAAGNKHSAFLWGAFVPLSNGM